MPLRRLYILNAYLLLLRVIYFPFVYSADENGNTVIFRNESDKEILDTLLNNRGYDKRSRPGSLTNIQVQVLLHSLSSPDESSLNYEVEFLLYRTWKDDRLKYDDGGRHKHLNGMSHVDDIWLPNTYIVKHGSLKDPLVDMSLRIYQNGTIVHIIRRAISINCQGNLKIFPFDNPKCPFAIESVALEDDELTLEWVNSSALKVATSIQSFNAYLIHYNTGKCGKIFTWRGKFSCLHVLLIFTRDKNYYFSSVFVPGMILVTSAFISFWLDKNVVPARVMIGVTTMLSFCTTTNNFRASLPVVSNLTAMNLWDGVCMFFIYVSLLEFVVVNYLYRKIPKEESTQPLSILCSKCKEIAPNDEEEKEKESDKSRFAWIRAPDLKVSHLSSKELSFKIENIAKVVFPTLFAIFVLTYFIVFAGVMPHNAENWEIQPSDDWKTF